MSTKQPRKHWLKYLDDVFLLVVGYVLLVNAYNGLKEDFWQAFILLVAGAYFWTGMGRLIRWVARHRVAGILEANDELGD